MSFCPKCGQALVSGATSCAQCGVTFSVSPTPEGISWVKPTAGSKAAASAATAAKSAPVPQSQGPAPPISWSNQPSAQPQPSAASYPAAGGVGQNNQPAAGVGTPSSSPHPGFIAHLKRLSGDRAGRIALIAVAACAVFLVVKLVLRFSESGDPYTLACKYKEGRDVPQDYARAATLFRKAAEAGNANAEFNLALLYQNGQGVEQDSNEALNWARKSADQNNAAGQTLLGAMYESGEGVSQDEAAAADLYNKAAYQGYPWAESLLANMYMSGRGNLEQDYVLAYKWFSRAASSGDETARSALQLLPGLMTDEQLRQAQELAQGD